MNFNLFDTLEKIEEKVKYCNLKLDNINIFQLYAKLIKFLGANIVFGRRGETEIYTLSYSISDSVKPNFNVGYIDRYRFTLKLLIKLIFQTRKIISHYPGYKLCLLLPLIKAYYMSEFVKEIGCNNFKMWGYSFTLEITALLNILRHKGIVVELLETVNFVEILNYVNCSHITHNSYIQSAYAAKLNNSYGKINHRHIIEFKDIKRLFINPLPICQNRIIVYYCSGANQRKRIGSPYEDEYLERLWQAELLNLKLLGEFSINCSNCQVILLPHYARLIESEDSAQSDYNNIVLNTNINICKYNAIQKIKSEANLSLSIKSNTFWDALYSGHKAMLMNPFPIDDFLESPLMRKFIFSPKISEIQLVTSVILTNLEMSRSDFFSNNFL